MKHRESHVTLLLILLAIALLAVREAHSVPEITYPAELDLDGDRIADTLDSVIARAATAGKPDSAIIISVMLFRPPVKADMALFREMGGTVRHVFRYATYGFSGTLAANRIENLAIALEEDLCIIEREGSGSISLDKSARQMRVRPLVWNPSPGYGLDGDPNIVIAIMDTGIDTEHPDIAEGRVVFWHDFTDENKLFPKDYNGHGTHVAGIAAGTGEKLGSGNITSLTWTFSKRFPVEGDGWFTMADIPVAGDKNVTLTLHFTEPVLGEGGIELRKPDGTSLGDFEGMDPVHHTYAIPAAGIFRAYVWNIDDCDGQPFALKITNPYDDVGDGFNLFRGMAPACKLAGAKVCDINGDFDGDDMKAAFDSLAAVNEANKIMVSNTSANLNPGGASAQLQTAANGLVSSGTVVVVSAGNSHGDHTIVSPGHAMAEKVITVGAVNDRGEIAHYSSKGPAGAVIKPDVVAPGGSSWADQDVGGEIMSVDADSNDGQDVGLGDYNRDDYTNLSGTSMAAPHVAGLAALIIDAMEGTWDYSMWQPLHVKMLILMTATETNKDREARQGDNPSLDRGGKDTVEGYGMVNGDAAIEAVKNHVRCPPDTSVTFTFGDDPFDRRAWASLLFVLGPTKVTISLDVPAGGDFDLYLYSDFPTLEGEPVIVSKSVNAGNGIDESIVQNLPEEQNYFYVVAKRVDGEGEATLALTHSECAGVQANGEPAQDLHLRPNYPNPFMGFTTIPFTVAGEGSHFAVLKIYDARGTLVRTLVQRQVTDGNHTVRWEGRDDHGRPVAAGVYFAELDVDGRKETRRVTLAR